MSEVNRCFFLSNAIERIDDVGNAPGRVWDIYFNLRYILAIRGAWKIDIQKAEDDWIPTIYRYYYLIQLGADAK